MQNLKVSMRYEKAIYPVIKEEKITESFIVDLTNILYLINQSRDLKLLISSPIISHSKKLGVFVELFKDKISETSMNFLSLLVLKGRAKYISGIYNCIKFLYNKENKIVECKVISAFQLNEDTKTKIEQFLKDTTKGVVEVDYSVDSNVIGGTIIKIGDKVYDTTIKNQLKELKKTLLV